MMVLRSSAATVLMISLAAVAVHQVAALRVLSSGRVLTCMQAGEADNVDRRMALANTLAVAVGAAAASAAGAPQAAYAIGPVNMELDGVTYETCECPDNLKAGRIGGSFGGGASRSVMQQCVRVKCSVNNPTKNPLKDTAVFGFVVDESSGASMIANNPDFRSDAGQFATIDRIPPGDNDIEFVFVATYSKKDQDTMPPITFKSLKAISYPGGARFQELSPCELDSLSDECDEVSDEDRQALKEKKMRY